MKENGLSLEKFKERIGNNIKITRQFRNVTQRSLYELIDKSQATLSRYETGKSSMSIDSLFEICQYLDISLEDMVSKDLSFKDFAYMNSINKGNIFQEYKHYFVNRELNLYYISTSQKDRIIEAPLITGELNNESYIPFLFEVKHNSPDKQIYEGNLVLESQYAYFYIKNQNRNERGLIITYLYPQKNKTTPITLLGLMISISHGYEQRPCSQKCIISSQDMDLESIKPFLKMVTDEESFVNDDFITFLTKNSDKKIYNWINSKNHD